MLRWYIVLAFEIFRTDWRFVQAITFAFWRHHRFTFWVVFVVDTSFHLWIEHQSLSTGVELGVASVTVVIGLAVFWMGA